MKAYTVSPFHPPHNVGRHRPYCPFAAVDVFILTHKSSYSKLYNYMLKNYVGTLKFEIVVMEEEDAGSLDAIYQLRDRLTVAQASFVPYRHFLQHILVVVERFYCLIM